MEQADITEHILSYLGVKKAHILTHDYGVSVMQELLARKVNFSILSVSFLNGALFPDLHRARLVQRLLENDILGPIVSKFMTYYSFRRSLGEVFGPNTQPTEEQFKDFWNLVMFNGGHLISHK